MRSSTTIPTTAADILVQQMQTVRRAPGLSENNDQLRWGYTCTSVGSYLCTGISINRIESSCTSSQLSVNTRERVSPSPVTVYTHVHLGNSDRKIWASFSQCIVSWSWLFYLLVLVLDIHNPLHKVTRS